MNRDLEHEIKERTSQLDQEFRSIRDHPRIVDIFSGLYIYDSSLPTPSKDYILLVTFAVLRDPQLLAELENMDIEEGRVAIVEKARSTSNENSLLLAEAEIRRRLMVRYLYPRDDAGNGAADWNQIVHRFRHGIEGPRFVVRSICHQAMELLVARAVLMSDFKSLEGLARATREDHFDEFEEPPSRAREIISCIVWDLPHLAGELAWAPSKEAAKLFILSMHPELSDNPTTWANIWRQFPADYFATGQRLTKERRAEIVALARKLAR